MAKKMGRPRINVDWEQVDKLCMIHCTGEEIASILGCSYDTLALRCKEDHDITFPEYFKQKSAAGKVSLRRRQFTAAMDGDKTMLIWLGKNILGQRESPDGVSDRQEINIRIVQPDA